MLNIIKQILRQSLHDRLLLLGAACVLAVSIIPLAFGETEILRETGSEFVGELAGFLCVLLPIAAGIVTARACGADLRDKTANYELLYGRKRAQVYFGRFFAALILLCAVTLTAVLAPISLLTLVNGWGASIPVPDFLLHFGMLFPMLFRIVCFYTALSFLCGNDIIPMTVAYIGTMVLLLSSFLISEAGFSLTWHTAATDLITLLDFSNTTSGFFNGEDITVYKAALSGGTVLRMLCTSFGIGLLWLLGGFAFFRKRDI